MANIFQNILNPDSYLYWFPPSEDKNDESIIYIHFNLPNSTFILNKNNNTTRYNLIKLFEKIHDEDGVCEELYDDIKTFFVVNNKQEFKLLIKSLKLFEKEQVVFMGETELQIDNCKINNLWVTKFYKTCLSTSPTNNNDDDEDTFSEDNYNVNNNSDNNSDIEEQKNKDNNNDGDNDGDDGDDGDGGDDGNLIHVAVIDYNESSSF
tara:strand:+ start:263 stop:883 length:621 start_codon:yes stop_codon:yes gene_type:complete